MPKNLAQFLLEAVQEARFEEVVDFGPVEEACPGAPFCQSPAPRIAHSPNVDLAVLRLSPTGELLEQANVLLSRDYPNGLIVPVDTSRGVESVQFLRWDIARWNGGEFSAETGHQLNEKGWTDNPPLTNEDDLVPGREQAPYFFMSPYPASNFKLLVAYFIMRLVDRGIASLDQLYTYVPNPSEPPQTRALRDWLDSMITWSDNDSTKALLKFLAGINQLQNLNIEFARLGLSTLQISVIDPVTGYNWQPGQINMTAYDTARLLWLIEGPAGPLWTGPGGQIITAAELSADSRTYLKHLLADQALHEALSTGLIYGAPKVEPGIPALVPERWLDPVDGVVRVAGLDFGCDARPNNSKAEVSFAHKTGLTYNYAADAGIVHSLPGQPFRHYIIAFFANLGYRYADPVFAANSRLPYLEPVTPIAYTQRIARLGRQIDEWMKQAYSIT